jgi:hypothetical protein
MPGGGHVLAGLGQLLRGIFVKQFVEQLVEWILGRNV